MKTKITIILICCMALFACSEKDIIPNQKEKPGQGDKSNMQYGIRWQIGNNNDLGEHCFDAEGLKASFGVGSTPGTSDFDSIYPWSEVKRCNLRKEGGKTIITYDNEPGFSLDGSNGDVFVRIPKFYVKKYSENGYEYRVISAKGTKPHPAFIENGKEIDAVYISAFEGYIDENGKMRSIADKIPTSNIVPKQFLDAAKARGRGYTLYDMRTLDMLYTLVAVEFGCRNTGVIFGHGIADFRQPIEKEWDKEQTYYSTKNEKKTNSITCKRQWRDVIIEGSNICICNGSQKDILTFAKCTSKKKRKKTETYYFDGPAIDINTDCFIGNCAQRTNWTETCTAPHNSKTGRANMVTPHLTTENRNPMRYRWIENIVGNIWHLMPDVTFKDLQMYVCDNIDDYEMYKTELPYRKVGEPLPENNDNGDFILIDRPGKNFWITSLIDNSGISFGKEWNKNLTSRQAFGAYYYLSKGLTIIANGGGFDHGYRCNMLTNRAWIRSDKKWHLYGARLIYKPIE